MADVSLIVATTLAHWAPDMADQISDRNAFMAFMKVQDKRFGGRGDKRFVVVPGGENFRETIFFNLNSTFRGYTQGETIDTTEGNPVKEARFDHKIVAGSIKVDFLDDARNTTKYEIRNLAQVKRKEAEISMSEVMGAAALSNGTTDTSIPAGLQHIISLTSANVGTIDEASNSGWAPFRDTTGVSAWNTSDEGLIALDNAFENCTRGPEKPDCIVTTVKIKSLINIMMIKNSTLNREGSTEMAAMGFDTIKYRGAEIMADDNVPTGLLYLVNTKWTRFQVLSKGNFAMTKEKEPVGGLYKVMQLYVFSNFTTGARRLNGVMSAITG